MHRQIITFLLVITLLIQPAGYSFSEVHAAENSGSSYGTPSEDGGGPESDNGEDNGVSNGSGQEPGEGTDETDGESAPEEAKARTTPQIWRRAYRPSPRHGVGERWLSM